MNDSLPEVTESIKEREKEGEDLRNQNF